MVNKRVLPMDGLNEGNSQPHRLLGKVIGKFFEKTTVIKRN
jgi:hypothetical protein